MDATTFEQQVHTDAELRAFLQGVTEEVAADIALDAPTRYVTVTGVDLLFSIAAYALYRWVKDTLDHRRADQETAVAERQAKLIAMLIADGFPPDKAEKVAIALLKRLSDEAKDDPILKKAQALLEK